MQKKKLFALWGGLFVLSAALGFIPEPESLVKALMVLLAAGFFVPGFLLLRLSVKTDDRHTLKLIRNLAALSLVLTATLLTTNFLSICGSETLGNILYYILTIVSAPMVCGQYWAVSLFLWAYLMLACQKALTKKK